MTCLVFLLVGNGSKKFANWRHDTVAIERSVFLLADVLTKINVKAASKNVISLTNDGAKQESHMNDPSGNWQRDGSDSWERWSTRPGRDKQEGNSNRNGLSDSVYCHQYVTTLPSMRDRVQASATTSVRQLNDCTDTRFCISYICMNLAVIQYVFIKYRTYIRLHNTFEKFDIKS